MGKFVKLSAYIITSTVSIYFAFHFFTSDRISSHEQDDRKYRDSWSQCQNPPSFSASVVGAYCIPNFDIDSLQNRDFSNPIYRLNKLPREKKLWIGDYGVCPWELKFNILTIHTPSKSFKYFLEGCSPHVTVFYLDKVSNKYERLHFMVMY